MKKLLYVLTGLCLLAGVFAGCEKEPEKANSTIEGVITDRETGEPLSGVTLTLQPDNKQVQTAEDGTYIIENLKAGTYTLKAKKDGYMDYTKKKIQLVDGQITTLNIKMEEPFVEFHITDEIGKPIEEMGCGIESSFKITNIGNIAGKWSIEYDADWITEISPNRATLEAGVSEYITIKKKLHEEDKETVLTVKTDKEDLHLKVVSKGFTGIELVYVEGGEF